MKGVETKRERIGPFTMEDSSGHDHQVFALIESNRRNTLSGAGEWRRGSIRLICGSEPVEALADGTFQLATQGTRMAPLPEQAQALAQLLRQARG